MRRPSSDGETLFTINSWIPVPTFHDWGERHIEDGKVYIRMACGLTFAADHWRLTRIRRDHAQRIGRPCVPCFKKGMAWAFRSPTTHQSWRYAS